MSVAESDRSLGTSTFRPMLVGTLVAVVGGAIFLSWVLRSPDFPLLVTMGSGQWIAPPTRVDTNAIAIHPDALPVARFIRRFELPSGGPLQIRLTAMRGYQLRLNGKLIGQRDSREGNWKREQRFDVSDGLQAVNSLAVEVRNSTGPALLRLTASAPDFELASDSSWSALDSRANSRPALVADDTRGGVAGLQNATTWQLLRTHRDALIGIATICALLSIGLSTRRSPGPRLLSAAAWTFAIGVWGVLALTKGAKLPAFVGFDGPTHIDYVRFILDNGKLPLADQGFSMYHPPLFYGLGAGVVALLGGGGGAQGPAREAAETAMRAITGLAGFAQIGIAFALCRRLFPGDALRSSLTVVICALLPVNLYMAMYVSNEPLNAALAGLALLITTDLLLRDELPLPRLIALGAVLGLALLTKATSLLLIPLIGVALAFKHARLDRAHASGLLLRAVVVGGAAAAISGWYFVRNMLEIGRPIVGNWNLVYNEVGWYQQPGFHTPSYYLRFGDVLTRPYFAGFHSFWDGMYSTFWGDGLVAGVVKLAHRHSLWSYDYMSIAYVLALPATGIVLAGIAAFCFSSAPDARRRVALAFLGICILAYGLAVLVMTLRLPFYAQAKASYALSVVAPVSVAAAHSFAWLQNALSVPERRWLRVLLHAWAGAFAIVVVMTFCG